ncbi:MAG: hypothetical protein ACRCW9_06385 [Cetobacterium sp.]
MGINLTIGAALALLTIWAGRLKAVIESVKEYKRTKDTRQLKPIIKVIKLFAFDIIVTLGTILIVGQPSSMFATQFIVMVNAITTILAELFFKLSKLYSDSLRKESMKEASYI